MMAMLSKSLINHNLINSYIFSLVQILTFYLWFSLVHNLPSINCDVTGNESHDTQINVMARAMPTEKGETYLSHFSFVSVSYSLMQRLSSWDSLSEETFIKGKRQGDY